MLVKYNALNMLAVAGAHLVPGTNDVSAESWAAMKKYPKVQQHLKSGVIQVIGGEDSPVDATGIDRLTENEAIDLVRNTGDEKMLIGWTQTEKREAVIEALEQQLEKLAKATAQSTPAQGKKGK